LFVFNGLTAFLFRALAHPLLSTQPARRHGGESRANEPRIATDGALSLAISKRLTGLSPLLGYPNIITESSSKRNIFLNSVLSVGDRLPCESEAGHDPMRK
jgi:hypothetical protein